MAEGIDIRVTASGAQQAQQQLQGVAGAEQQVAAAAKGTTAPVAAATAAQKDHGAAIDFNRGAYKEFRQALAFLGPEFAVVGEAVQAMTMRHGQAAVGLGILSAALVGVSMVYGKIQKSIAEADAAEKASLDALREKRDIYAGLTEQIEKAIAAEAQMMGRTPTASPEALLAQAAEVGTRVPMGKAGVEFMAKSMGAGGGKLGAGEADLFAAWVATGRAGELKPEQAVEMFRSEMAAPGAADQLRGQLAGFVTRAPGLVGPRLAEAGALRAGGSAAAESQAIFKRVAEAETVAGRARDPGKIQSYVEALVSGERQRAGRDDLDAAARELLATYPELRRAQVFEWSPYGAQGRTQRRLIAPGETGQTTIGQIFYGGSQVILQGMEDPSGTPVPGTISYTGR
jgi:hypothetical protein